MFAKISRDFGKTFEVFAGFCKFFEVFGLAWTCLDLFGSIRMHLDVLECVGMRSDAFGRVRKIWIFFEKLIEKYVFRNFGKVLEELEANGPQNQLPNQILLQIHLS